MQNLIDSITEVITNIQEDVTKFDTKGNKAAGTRIRKAMQTLKALAQDVRNAVSEANNA